jgi:hypothetical protein
MAKTAATEAACGPDFTYLSIQGPSTVYCFTFDVREGDCLDVDVLKTPCASATQKVLRVVPGPETDSTCQDVPGVDTVILAGPEPASVACVGPNR